MKAQTPEVTARRIASAPAHYAGMIAHPTPRFAAVRGARTVREVEAYLPASYAVMESFETLPGGRLVVIIGGYDNAGWTLEGYVMPRLASGWIACEEIPA